MPFNSRTNNGRKFRVDSFWIPQKCGLFYQPPLSPLNLKLLQVDEQAYVYQRIGFQCLLETRFEDAGFCLFQGELDPRILISYFPELRGALLDEDPTIDVFSGIDECMPAYDSIDDISTSLFPDPFPAILPFPPLPHTRNDALSPPLPAANFQSSPT
jgi:hypothetical protein